MTETTQTSTERPLSPHLQIYRPQMTSVLSILHRLTGVALAIGTLVLVWWLMAAATGEAAYDTFSSYAHSILGRLFLFGWTLALSYHMFNGIRHLFWDTGRLFEIKNAFTAGRLVLALAVITTLAIWYLGYASLGGF